MNQDEKRQLENQLISMGFSGIQDPEMCAIFARFVEDFPYDKHWFFRGLINECDPKLRREMYYSIRPHFSNFKPHPLETYLSQITEQAEALISQRVMRVEGKRPDAIEVGGEHFVEAGPMDIASHTLVKLTCGKCTKQKVFKGNSQVDAVIKARDKGWVWDPMREKHICPKCPAVREGARTGHA